MSAPATEEESAESAAEHDFIDLKTMEEVEACERRQLLQYVEKLHGVIRKCDKKLAAYKQKLIFFVSATTGPVEIQQLNPILIPSFISQIKLTQEEKSFRDKTMQTSEKDFQELQNSKEGDEVETNEMRDPKEKTAECESRVSLFHR